MKRYTNVLLTSQIPDDETFTTLYKAYKVINCWQKPFQL